MGYLPQSDLLQLEQAAEHGDMTVLQAVLKSDSQVATVVQVGVVWASMPLFWAEQGQQQLGGAVLSHMSCMRALLPQAMCSHDSTVLGC